jgi:hypothetical protein
LSLIQPPKVGWRIGGKEKNEKELACALVL